MTMVFKIGSTWRRPAYKKLTHHKIGFCTNCGWVHKAIYMRRMEEITPKGKIAVKRPLCETCVKAYEGQVICTLCGRTAGDNLYPVPVMRHKMDGGHTCNLLLFLCKECRKLPHEEVLRRVVLPKDICKTCKDKFLCYTLGHLPPDQSRQDVEGRYRRRKTPKVAIEEVE